jgi:hypothetical protein
MKETNQKLMYTLATQGFNEISRAFLHNMNTFKKIGRIGGYKKQGECPDEKGIATMGQTVETSSWRIQAVARVG